MKKLLPAFMLSALLTSCAAVPQWDGPNPCIDRKFLRLSNVPIDSMKLSDYDYWRYHADQCEEYKKLQKSQEDIEDANRLTMAIVGVCFAIGVALTLISLSTNR